MIQLSEIQVDVLKELINVGVGKGAEVLNTMLNAHIALQVPSVSVLDQFQLISYLKGLNENELAVVNLPFSGEICGSTKLLFPTESALKLVEVFTGEVMTEADMDSLRAGTLSEIGNIVINAVMGSISNMLDMNFQYIVPDYMEGSIEEIIPQAGEKAAQPILLAQTHFNINQYEIVGDIAIFLEFGSLDILVSAIENFINP